MKPHFFVTLFLTFSVISFSSNGQTQNNSTSLDKHYYIDVHHLGAGKVTYADVAKAHTKDLAVEGKYGVEFIKFWVDTAKGDVYCLSSASDTASIIKTHREAHGLLPNQVYMVTPGKESAYKGDEELFLDIHELGPGNVTADAVAAAHQKDLAVEGKYGVNFINYWVDEKQGVVVCLSEAPNSNAIVQTHKEAHGLIPKYIVEVEEGK